MRPTTAALAMLLGGCLPETVEEACKDDVPGEKWLSDSPTDFLLRLNCHRRFVGLAQVPVKKLTQEAVEGHANYLEVNGLLDPLSPNYAVTLDQLFVQDRDLLGFTGADAYDRLDAAAAYDSANGEVGLWNVVMYEPNAVEVENMIYDPYLRDAFFQPLVYSIGMDSFQADAVNRGVYINLLYSFPPARRLFKPVVYPRDGQTGVPPAYRPSRGPTDPLAVADFVGFPITITVGAEEVTGSVNPYDLVLRTASLTGPEGNIPLTVVEPNRFPWGDLQGTIILGPQVPLQTSSTYELVADIEWNFGKRTVEATFTTTDGYQVVE